eukprot:7060522-Prymnesium_polylepis.1
MAVRCGQVCGQRQVCGQGSAGRWKETAKPDRLSITVDGETSRRFVGLVGAVAWCVCEEAMPVAARRPTREIGSWFMLMTRAEHGAERRSKTRPPQPSPR